MSKFTESHDNPGGALRIIMGIDPDNRVHLDFGGPITHINLEAGTTLTLAALLIDKGLIATAASGTRAVAEYVTDEAAFRRQLYGEDLPAGEERAIDIDMGHWTLRVVVGVRGLAEIRKQVTE